MIRVRLAWSSLYVPELILTFFRKPPSAPFKQHSHNVGRAAINGRTAQKEDADPQVEQGAHGPNGQAVEGEHGADAPQRLGLAAQGQEMDPDQVRDDKTIGI